MKLIIIFAVGAILTGIGFLWLFNSSSGQMMNNLNYILAFLVAGMVMMLLSARSGIRKLLGYLDK
jgi:ABC-type Fe3+ transport system permease subunit